MIEDQQNKSLNQEIQNECSHFSTFQQQEENHFQENDFQVSNENQQEHQFDQKQHTSSVEDECCVDKVNSQNEQQHHSQQGQINQEINNNNSQFQNSNPNLNKFLLRCNIQSKLNTTSKVYKNLFIKIVALYENYPKDVDKNIGLDQIERQLDNMNKSWYDFCDITQEINVEDNQNQLYKRSLKLDFKKIKDILLKYSLNLSKKVPFCMINKYEKLLKTLEKEQKENSINQDDDIQQIRDLIQYLQTVKQKKQSNKIKQTLNFTKNDILELYALPEIKKLFDYILYYIKDDTEKLLKSINLKYQDNVISIFKNSIQSFFEPSRKVKKSLKVKMKFQEQVNSLSNSKYEENQQDQQNFNYKEQQQTLPLVQTYGQQQQSQQNQLQNYSQSQEQQNKFEEQSNDSDQIYIVSQNFYPEQISSPLPNFNYESANE